MQQQQQQQLQTVGDMESVDAVKAKATEVMKKLSEKDLQHCFQQWKIRMERCRCRGGDHFEGDNNYIV
jgi:hypothetical protein